MPGIRVPWTFSGPKGRARSAPFIPLPPGTQARGQLLGGESLMGVPTSCWGPAAVAQALGW